MIRTIPTRFETTEAVVAQGYIYVKNQRSSNEIDFEGTALYANE